MQHSKTWVRIIWVISIVIPLVVAVLLNPRFPQINLGFDTMILPKINAFINSGVSILLILGLIFIKQRKPDLHRMCMLGAFGLSAIFLVSYVLYHLSTGHTSYCEEGAVPAGVYYFVLITHILLSVFIVPLATFSIYRALTERLIEHRKLAKITFPLWLYVSVTGVLVYVLISPCYA